MVMVAKIVNKVVYQYSNPVFRIEYCHTVQSYTDSCRSSIEQKPNQMCVIGLHSFQGHLRRIKKANASSLRSQRGKQYTVHGRAVGGCNHGAAA